MINFEISSYFDIDYYDFREFPLIIVIFDCVIDGGRLIALSAFDHELRNVLSKLIGIRCIVISVYDRYRLSPLEVLIHLN